jgi:hypothetical protein
MKAIIEIHGQENYDVVDHHLRSGLSQEQTKQLQTALQERVVRAQERLEELCTPMLYITRAIIGIALAQTIYDRKKIKAQLDRDNPYMITSLVVIGFGIELWLCGEVIIYQHRPIIQLTLHNLETLLDECNAALA